MAITFQRKIKKQKNLVFVLLILVLIAVFIIWRGQDLLEEIPFESSLTGFKEIKIDFGIFEDPFFKELQPLEKIPVFEGALGRENPFSP